jgi:dethiobiotin synthetase
MQFAEHGSPRLKPVSRILFVTGTDTAVGKTTVTALLLAHALTRGGPVRALKPLSSGDRGDEAIFRELQGASEINFAHFDLPLAPWSVARRAGDQLGKEPLLEWLLQQSQKCELLLVEGAGGLLSPLGERFTALDLIEQLRAEVVVVARNRLGVLNQVLLVLAALASRPPMETRIALIAEKEPDFSARTNYEDLIELVRPIEVIRLSYLNDLKPNAESFRAAAAKLDDALALLLGKKNPPDTEPRGFFP